MCDTSVKHDRPGAASYGRAVHGADDRRAPDDEATHQQQCHLDEQSSREGSYETTTTHTVTDYC